MPVRTWAPNHRVAAPKRLKLIQKDDFFGIPKCPSIVVLIIWIAICMPDFQSCRAYKSEDFLNAFVHQNFDVYSGKYGVFEESRRLELREETRRMFVHAYDSYMRFAFPMDELNPVSCEGRGPDYDNPLNININDVLGDYCLTLVDSLDSLAVLGNETEFRRAVQLVIDYVSFDKDNTVQVFEATIRELGGLLSAHLIITDPKQLLGNFSIPKYNDELLHLAHDLASRLLPAFEGTNTGIPYPRVNLIHGVHKNCINESNPAAYLWARGVNLLFFNLKRFSLLENQFRWEPVPMLSIVKQMRASVSNSRLAADTYLVSTTFILQLDYEDLTALSLRNSTTMISLVIIYLFLLDSVSIIDTGAGSLLLEFGILSRLLGDPTFEGVARRTNRALWEQRDPITGLLGNLINVQTAEWVGVLSGLGASLDSFFEYMLKAYVLFGEPEDYKMFNESYSAIQKHLRKGRDICHLGYGDPPIYVNGNMRDGSILNTWIDSLQAAFIGVQVLYGEVSEAMCMHALYYSIWKKFGLMPERFNWKLKAADVGFYPLRPEFIESTYFLYQATKNPFYLHVGKEILQNLNTYTRTSCGFATVHSVEDMSHEDRMESFVLAETFKYLFLLFDVDNPVNKHYEKFLFSTEGHLFPIRKEFHTGSSHWPKSAAETLAPRPSVQPSTCPTVKPSTSVPANKENAPAGDTVVVVAQPVNRSSVVEKCDNFPFPRFALPMDSHYFRQMDLFVGHPVSYSGSSEMLHYCQSS